MNLIPQYHAFNKVYVKIFGLVWMIFFLIGIISYEGSKILYSIYSIVFLLLLGSALFKQTTYGYSFIALLTWMGFWLKHSYHAVLDYRFVEPTGGFSASASNWDEVLFVSLSAATGILISRFLISSIFKGKQSIISKSISYSDNFFKTKNIFPCFSAILLLTSILNLYFGIFVVGFNVRTALPWHLNGLITVMITCGGFSIIFSCLLWVAVKENFRSKYLLTYIFSSGIILSLSTLSRGLIVFFTLPYLYALFKNRNYHSELKKINFYKVFLTAAVFFVATFILVTTIRDHVYYKVEPISTENISPKSLPPSGLHQLTATSKNNEAREEFVHNTIERALGVLNFSVDRWLGVEGVMAVSAFPGKGFSLLLEGIKEAPLTGGYSVYQIICPWPIDQLKTIKGNVQLFSQPGGVAFLYYSGSLSLVLLGTLLICFVIQIIEFFIFDIIGNPFLCAFLGWHFGFGFVNFGGVPRYSVPGALFNIFLFFLIYIFFTRNSPLKFVRKIHGDANEN